MNGQQPIPSHVLDHLETKTGVNYRIVSRRARKIPCPHCSTWIWRGLDADDIAFDAKADTIPLNPIGESLALLSGLSTWRIGIEGGRLELDHRDVWRIQGTTAGSLYQADVIPAHQCGRIWPVQCRAPSRIPGPIAASVLIDPRTERKTSSW